MTPTKWTREVILDAIRQSAIDGRAKAKDMTLCTVARRMFGSWSSACIEAGVKAMSDITKYESCTVDNCSNLARSVGSPYCEKHYYRIRRRGHLGVTQYPGRTTTSNGYALLRRPGHVLARTGGYALEHRVVLYEKIGPGEHPCHWCGRPVRWELSYPQSIDALVGDHLDEDKANNEPSNLVPSCNPCNIERGRHGGKALVCSRSHLEIKNHAND